MGNDVKVIIVEKNGVDLEDSEEYILLADDIPFDGTQSVKDAIDGLSGAELTDLVTVRCIPGTTCIYEANLLIDKDLQFLKQEVC